MGRRFKGDNWKPSLPREIGPGAQKHIDAGEPWLGVWHRQLTIPLTTMARKSKLPIDRILCLERGIEEPTAEELHAIADAMGTTVELIQASRIHGAIAGDGA